MSDEWVGVYKLVRLGVLALALLGITLWVFKKSNRERLERPAQRMLEDDDV